MKNSSKEFLSTFNSLKEILKKYEKHFKVTSNKIDAYNLYVGYSEKYKRDTYFGGVVVNKNYVSYHLMPVYVNPKLLESISAELKKRMQGKSCFNFTTIDKKLLKDLSNLTKKGFEFYKTNGTVMKIVNFIFMQFCLYTIFTHHLLNRAKCTNNVFKRF